MWAFVRKTASAHYFVDGKSVCGRHEYQGQVLTEGEPSFPCRTCKIAKAAAERKAQEALAPTPKRKPGPRFKG